MSGAAVALIRCTHAQATCGIRGSRSSGLTLVGASLHAVRTDGGHNNPMHLYADGSGLQAGAGTWPERLC
jgi:hypothetical protein